MILFLRKTRLRITSIACAGLLLVLASSAAAAPGAAERKTCDKNKNVCIHTGAAYLDLEKGIYSIPATVTVEIRDMKLTGADVRYEEKTRTLKILKGPVHIVYGKNITANADTVSADLENRVVTGEGCTVTQDWATGTVAAAADIVRLDMKKDSARITGNVRFRFVAKITPEEAARRKQKEEEKRAEEETETKIKKEPLFPQLKTDVVSLATQELTYDMKERTLVAPETVRMEIEEGWLQATSLQADLEAKTVEAREGIDGQVRNVSFHADRATTNYEKKHMVLEGNVHARRGDDVYTAARVEYSYAKGERTLRVTGSPVDLQMLIPENRKEENTEKPGGAAEPAKSP